MRLNVIGAMARIDPDKNVVLETQIEHTVAWFVRVHVRCVWRGFMSLPRRACADLAELCCELTTRDASLERGLDSVVHLPTQLQTTSNRCMVLSGGRPPELTLGVRLLDQQNGTRDE